MKIAVIAEHANPFAGPARVEADGQNVHVEALARGLARRGHTVEVLTRRDGARDAPVEPVPGVTVVHVPVGEPGPVANGDLPGLMDDCGDRVEERWRRRGDPDVVHAHFWTSGLAALRAGRRRRVPVAQTFHALGSVQRRLRGTADTSPPGRQRLEHAVAQEVDLIIATCRNEVEELRHMGVDRTRMTIVPGGVDIARFTPGPRPRSPRRRVLLVGHGLVGCGIPIRALAQLPEDVELVIAGGPVGSVLAEELGVGSRVRLVGSLPHEDMPGLYRSADVVLPLPGPETFETAPLEAAACGRPVVGAAVDGLLDSVVDGVTGRLVPPGDVPALTGALRDLLDQPRIGRRMGHAGRVRAVAHHDWRVVTRSTEQALEEIRSPLPVSARLPSPPSRPGGGHAEAHAPPTPG